MAGANDDDDDEDEDEQEEEGPEVEEDKKASTYAGYAEAFTILAKYDAKRANVCAEHDEMYIGHGIYKKISKEDKLRLAQLGWTPHEGESFHRYV